jgi:hypothetical protein
VKIRETITLSGVEGLAEDLLHILSPTHPFERSGLSLILHQDYCPDTLEKIERCLASTKLRPRIFHNIYPEFDDADFSSAPLLNIAFPDLSVGGESLVVKCPACGTRRTEREHRRRVRRVGSSAPLLTVNGAVDILSSSALEELGRAGLRGLEPWAFDEEDRYFYLATRSDLGPLVVHTDESRGYRGRCPVCDKPLFEVHFGAFRFARDRWSGDDFVWAELIDRAVVSQDAYAHLILLGAEVTRLSPVLLD